jgi:hypothetical protein
MKQMKIARTVKLARRKEAAEDSGTSVMDSAKICAYTKYYSHDETKRVVMT